MTALEALLAEEIRLQGPIHFHRFMEASLYHPRYGYYRRRLGDDSPGSDPFGKHGDFYTAEQIQPVFGILVAARIRQLYREMGEPADFTVVELGAGRGEMAQALSEWPYVPLDIDSGALPERFRGVVFSNEFFDALPVDAVVYQEGLFRERLVGRESGRFVWAAGVPVRPQVEAYLRRFFPPPSEGWQYEVNLEALGWMARIAQSLEAGYVLTIDYGYTRAESVRFPAGSLMSYRRHIAREDVLEDAGERDITAHVNFSALEEAGVRCGLHRESFQTLAQMLLAAGEADQFAAALNSGVPSEELRRRMQLKTLLFGMGETFRVLLQRRSKGLEGIGKSEAGA